MKPLACIYSIIRFVPHFETGEFANVGIVLACPQSGYFSFVLQDKRAKRVTDFFNAVDRNFYLKAIKATEEELARLQAAAYANTYGNKAENIRAIFARLTQPRETIVRFGHTRVLLTPNPKEELQKKFEHFVEHSFATPEYVENTMNSRLRVLLGDMELETPFRPAKIGDDILNARFDFVQTINGEHKKVIKALNLQQNDANDIAAHGDVWLGKLSRLQKRRELPSDVLVNVALPDKETERHAVGREIVRELEQLRFIVVAGDGDVATSTIRKFARAQTH